MILCRSRWRKAKYRVSSTHLLSLRSWSIKFLYDLATTTGRLSRCRSCLLTVLAQFLLLCTSSTTCDEFYLKNLGSVGAYQGLLAPTRFHGRAAGPGDRVLVNRTVSDVRGFP